MTQLIYTTVAHALLIRYSNVASVAVQLIAKITQL